MNSYKARILISCCFIAAVGLTVRWIGIKPGLSGEQLSLIHEARAAGDRVTDLDDTAPQRVDNSTRPSGRSRKSEFAEFLLNRRLDTNCVETMWRSKLIKKQDLTERGLKTRE